MFVLRLGDRKRSGNAPHPGNRLPPSLTPLATAKSSCPVTQREQTTVFIHIPPVNITGGGAGRSPPLTGTIPTTVPSHVSVCLFISVPSPAAQPNVPQPRTQIGAVQSMSSPSRDRLPPTRRLPLPGPHPGRAVAADPAPLTALGFCWERAGRGKLRLF